jgi:hypothetical protein
MALFPIDARLRFAQTRYGVVTIAFARNDPACTSRTAAAREIDAVVKRAS